MDPASDKPAVAASAPIADQTDNAASTAVPPAEKTTTAVTNTAAAAPTTDACACEIGPERTSNGSATRNGPSLDIDTKRPEDFKGEVQTTNDLPSREDLKKTEDYIVLDRDGRTHTFKSLYTGPNVPRRVLVVFVRHFFCGVSCHDSRRYSKESCLTKVCYRIARSTCAHLPNPSRPTPSSVFPSAHS